MRQQQDRQPHPLIIKTPFGFTLNQFRHSTINSIIKDKQVSRVLDLGCSQGEFMRLVARSQKLQLLVGIDLDESAITSTIKNTLPEGLQVSIRFGRANDLRVMVFKGDLLEQYPELKTLNFELITLIEVIQHLHLHQIDQASSTIFGYLRPKYVVFTTPNKEFNVFFGDKERLRHWDHKFQWTRMEFNRYCQSISDQYGYNFSLRGIGEHVNDHSNGCCTQMAIFSLPSILGNSKPDQMPPKKDKAKIELYLREKYLIPCWRSSLDSIMRDLFYKGIGNSTNSSFENLIEIITESSPLALCLQNQNIALDVSFLLSQIDQFRSFFDWDNEGYTLRLMDQSEEMSEFSFSHEHSSYGKENSRLNSSLLSRNDREEYNLQDLDFH